MVYNFFENKSRFKFEGFDKSELLYQNSENFNKNSLDRINLLSKIDLLAPIAFGGGEYVINNKPQQPEQFAIFNDDYIATKRIKKKARIISPAGSSIKDTDIIEPYKGRFFSKGKIVRIQYLTPYVDPAIAPFVMLAPYMINRGGWILDSSIMEEVGVKSI